MPYELDHVLRFVPDPEAALALAAELGLVVGHHDLQPNTGAGHTICFFDNVYLEIVWPEPGKRPFPDAPRMRFGERCLDDDWLPYGVAIRPVGPRIPPPFATWDYPAPFLPPGAIPIPIGANSERPGEPLLIVSWVAGRPDRRTPAPPLQESLRELTAVHLTLPGVPSTELEAARRAVPLTLEQGTPELRLHVDATVRSL